MAFEEESGPNVSSVVPLLMVTSMERSLRFYVDGLQFAIRNRWEPEGRLRWCWMTLGEAALMLQEISAGLRDRFASAGKFGNGVGLNFQCKDALRIYRLALERGIAGREPQVGNGNWEVSLKDPDGYSIHFNSPTDVPEETLLSQVEGEVR